MAGALPCRFETALTINHREVDRSVTRSNRFRSGQVNLRRPRIDPGVGHDARNQQAHSCDEPHHDGQCDSALGIH